MPSKPSHSIDFLTLHPFQKTIEKLLRASIEEFGAKTKLRDACEYALLNGGKRFRPALVLIIAESIGMQADASYAALAVEFFHTASLIADDLPSMDDDDERRNKPSLHKVYGEALALLASYGLIAAGYEFLAKNAKVIQKSSLSFASQSDRIGMLALENTTYNTGLLGATGGQFLDVFPPDVSLSTIKDVIRMKTVSLFEISFVLGWLYGSGDLKKLDLVKKAALHFGMAFQIADDIGDMEQDKKNGRQINVANLCGKTEASQMLLYEVAECQMVLKQLGLGKSALFSLVNDIRNPQPI